jgi:putative endonuclease
MDAGRLGRRGERAAVRALRRAGYRILGRNVRTPAGEVDVVALEGETLVLVEVKTTEALPGRAPPGARGPRATQRGRIRSAWRRFAALGDAGCRARRFDVVSVVFEGRRATCTIRRGAFRGAGEWST